MKLKFKKINHTGVTAKKPSKATSGAAGFDMYAAIANPVTIAPQEIVSIPTGVALGFPNSRYVGLLFARSGLGVKHGICLSNGVGVIDSDYTGEIVVGLSNISKEPYTIEPGERIAQLLVMEIPPVDIEWVEDIKKTKRNDSGFGSTGRF
jgi:dUTP pyrophosphatase